MELVAMGRGLVGKEQNGHWAKWESWAKWWNEHCVKMKLGKTAKMGKG